MNSKSSCIRSAPRPTRSPNIGPSTRNERPDCPHSLWHGLQLLKNVDQLGWEITFFAIVGLESQKEAVLSEFERMVAEWPEVRECHMLNGEIDFILKIVARDLQSFQEFLTSQLTSAPNVNSVKTSLTIRTAKDEPGVPIPMA